MITRDILAAHSRYNVELWADDTGRATVMALNSALAEMDAEKRWVAITALPRCAVKRAVITRDSVGPRNGNMAVGTTGSGRSVLAHMADVVSGSNFPDTNKASDEYAESINEKSARVIDTWIVCVCEKDPRTSAFFTDRDVWGNAPWTIVNQPAAEGLVKVPVGWDSVTA